MNAFNPFNPFNEPTDEELWDNASKLTGYARAEAMISLAQRMYEKNDFAGSAAMQERLADLLEEDGNHDDALVAIARATGAWTEIEEWDNIEALAARARTLEDKAFSAEAWRDYYSTYAWSAHQRRAPIVALEFIERAFACADELDSNHGRAFLLFQKGCMLATLGQLRDAARILNTALDEAREANAIPLIIDILAESSLIEAQLLNPHRALAAAREAETLLDEVYAWSTLRHRVNFALGSAYLADYQFDEAVEAFLRVIGDTPNYLKIRALIRLAECDHANAASWESRAYVLARNTNTWDLLNHLEINRAMGAEPQLAIPVLDTVVARAIEYDDDVTRDAARIVLARKYLDLADYRAAKEILDRVSAANFGDNMLKVITYLVLRADTLIELGQVVEARSIASTLTRIDPRPEFVDGIAEGYWQLAIIELDANGPTSEWQRHAHSSIAYLARGGNFALLRERAEALHGTIRANAPTDTPPITTVDDLLVDIRLENDGFSDAA